MHQAGHELGKKEVVLAQHHGVGGQGTGGRPRASAALAQVVERLPGARGSCHAAPRMRSWASALGALQGQAGTAQARGDEASRQGGRPRLQPFDNQEGLHAPGADAVHDLRQVLAHRGLAPRKG